MLPVRQNNSANFCIFLWLLHWNLTHTYTAGAIMHSTRTFVITVSYDRVSCRARTLNRNVAHAAAVIVTRAHCCLTAADHCYVMLGTIKFVGNPRHDSREDLLYLCYLHGPIVPDVVQWSMSVLSLGPYVHTPVWDKKYKPNHQSEVTVWP